MSQSDKPGPNVSQLRLWTACARVPSVAVLCCTFCSLWRSEQVNTAAGDVGEQGGTGHSVGQPSYPRCVNTNCPASAHTHTDTTCLPERRRLTVFVYPHAVKLQEMNSQGSSSKCPSSSSLSTPLFLLSESEQTEDDADVFAKEKYVFISKSCIADKDRTLSGRYSDLLSRSHQLHTSNADNNQSKHCTHKTKHADLPTSPGAATQGSSSATPGDLVFAQKCADLQRFVHPLLELLHGLKTGRFHKGLTSFQQSVAMDRLHRILGILQKPDMGERYLQNLLQIEMMLKIWFPQVALQSAATPNQTTTPKRPHRWCQNQLHMPVKKRKMSWSDLDQSSTIPNKHKHLQDERQGTFRAVPALDVVSTCLPGSFRKHKAPKRRTVEPAGPSCVCTDSTDTLSALSDRCCKKEKENQKQPEVFPPSPCDSLATQDSSVSSSTALADSP